MKFLFSIVLSLAGFQLIFARYGCRLEEIAKIAGADDEEQAEMPDTEEGLKLACGNMIALQEKMIKLAKECPSTEDMRTTIRFYESLLKAYRNICTTGTEMNTKYLENAKCLIELKNTHAIDKCVDTVSPEDISEVNSCRLNFMINGCVFKTVDDKCGRDATYVVKTFLQPMLDYQKDTCCSDRTSTAGPFKVDLSFF